MANTTLILTLPGGLALLGPMVHPITYNAAIAGMPPLSGLYGSTSGNQLFVTKADNSNFVVGAAPGIVTTFILPLA